jgi:hypothetical protein
MWTFLLILIILVILGAITSLNPRQPKEDEWAKHAREFRIEKTQTLLAAYKESLSGTDKQDALQRGRAYYAYLRGNGQLTIYDEQALANDLAAMKV